MCGDEYGRATFVAFASKVAAGFGTPWELNIGGRSGYLPILLAPAHATLLFMPTVRHSPLLFTLKRRWSHPLNIVADPATGSHCSRRGFRGYHGGGRHGWLQRAGPGDRAIPAAAEGAGYSRRQQVRVAGAWVGTRLSRFEYPVSPPLLGGNSPPSARRVVPLCPARGCGVHRSSIHL